MNSFAEKVTAFCSCPEYSGQLPARISIMNPFGKNVEMVAVISDFSRIGL
jgi:hypothetical protein